MSADKTTRRNVVFGPDLWERIQEAAANEGAAQKRPMSLSEWIRDACERKLAAQHKGERR